MKRDEAQKARIKDSFINHVFRGRDAKMLKNYFSGNVTESHTRVIDEFDDIEVMNIDEMRDKVTMLWEDYALHMIFTWRKAGNGKDFVLVNVE